MRKRAETLLEVDVNSECPVVMDVGAQGSWVGLVRANPGARPFAVAVMHGSCSQQSSDLSLLASTFSAAFLPS